MAINFDSLPINKPTNLPEPGPYYATIDEAEMRKPHDITKPSYLNLTLALKDSAGRNCGKMYDILSESDKELVQYKLARFLTALNLMNLGTFELADLVKIIKNKQLIVDVKIEEAKDGRPAKPVVDVFSGSIYYPMSVASEIFGNTTTPVQPSKPDTDISVMDDELCIDASDAADVHSALDDEF